jgi:hypothetical protein
MRFRLQTPVPVGDRVLPAGTIVVGSAADALSPGDVVSPGLVSELGHPFTGPSPALARWMQKPRRISWRGRTSFGVGVSMTGLQMCASALMGVAGPSLVIRTWARSLFGKFTEQWEHEAWEAKAIRVR